MDATSTLEPYKPPIRLAPLSPESLSIHILFLHPPLRLRPRFTAS